MAPHKVAVFVRDGVVSMELGLVHQVFGQARSATGDRLYDVRTVGFECGTVTTDSDFSVTVDTDIRWLAEADTVVVPAARGIDETLRPGDTGVELFRSAVPDGARVASICTAAFVVAAAGLLADGSRLTTHWLSADLLQKLYPRLVVDESVLFVDGGRILTSAGEASGIDLCVHMVRSDFGTEVANDVARRMVVAPHRHGGQSQFIDSAVVASDRVGILTELEPWLAAHLGDSFGLDALAESGAMSVRTMTRRFADEVGSTPWQWVMHRRVQEAQRLLEQSDISVERIAHRCGFGSSDSLRRHFSRRVGLSPRAFRRTFRGEQRPSAPIERDEERHHDDHDG